MAKYIPKYGKTTPRKKRKGVYLALVLVGVLVAGVLVASMSWDSVAKYIYQDQSEALVRAKNFYFTSDYLVPGGKTYTINSDGSDSMQVDIELRNYDGLLVSELDINYTIEVEGDATATASGDGIIEIAEGRETVTLSNMKPGGTYTITATGENGYYQTLQATFKVTKDPTGVYKNTKKYDDYVILTVWTQNQAAAVTISVPDGLIPDATDNVLTGKAAGNTIPLELDANESRTYRFFTTSGYAGGVVPVTYQEALMDETALS